MRSCLVVFSFLLIMLLSSTASAGELAIKVGFGLSDPNSDYTNQYIRAGLDGVTSLQIGVALGIPLGEYFLLSPEIHYLPKGSSAELVADNSSGGIDSVWTATSRVTYISFPVLLKIRMPAGLIRPFVAAGPRFDFKVGEDAESFLKDVYDEMDNVAYGFNIGGGAEIALAESYRLLVEVSYSWDVNSVYETDLSTWKNKNLSILAGICF